MQLKTLVIAAFAAAAPLTSHAASYSVQQNRAATAAMDTLPYHADEESAPNTISGKISDFAVYQYNPERETMSATTTSGGTQKEQCPPSENKQR